MGHMKNVWYEGDITEDVYIQALAWMAKRYKDDDTIIAYDLKNEPHGKPDESPRAIWNASNDKDNWKRVAEKAALAVLKENPNVLIVVEGIEIYPKDIKNNASYASKNSADYHYNWWGGTLRGVKDFPLDLGKYQNKLVYSPHDYGPTVYQQPWFYSGYNYDSLLKDVWRDNWLFIHEGKIAPLLIGEWGGFMSEPNLTWMTHMRTLISKYRLHHTFWCLNANSGDTGGLLEHDFATWDEAKYAFVKEVLWQHKGKFVGLSQEIPLGQNGISLSELK
jgi:aryl-phospho-beta-D-glucosidase BglC (GH1 family)